MAMANARKAGLIINPLSITLLEQKDWAHCYIFVSLRKIFKNRGAQNKRAENKPIEPAPGNAGEGNGNNKSGYLPLFPLDVNQKKSKR